MELIPRRFNGGSVNAAAIDAATDREIGTILLEGKPEFAVTDGTTICVNTEQLFIATMFDLMD